MDEKEKSSGLIKIIKKEGSAKKNWHQSKHKSNHPTQWIGRDCAFMKDSFDHHNAYKADVFHSSGK